MKVKIILNFLLISNILGASTTNIIKEDSSSTYNEIDDNYNDEVGFAFYKDENSTSITKVKEKNQAVSACDCKKIQKTLDGILSQNKKQTKIQQRILELLENELDPKPKKIVVNGKECIENSSAECFKMPITAAAKKVPALQAWMKDPSMKNTVNYSRWQAKLFKELFIRGDSLPMALSQYGSYAYPLPIKTQGYNTMKGYDIKNQLTENMIHSLKDKYSFILFIGLNKDLDVISTLNIVNLFKKYKDLDFSVVFKDNNSKDIFEGAINSIFSKEIRASIPYKKFTTDAMKFDTFQIYTTPSIVAIDKIDNKAQTIYVGSINVKSFEQNFINYLEYNKKLDYNKLNYFENWDNNINYRDKYFKNTLGIDIDKEIKSSK